MPLIRWVGSDTRYASGNGTRWNSRRSTSSVPSRDPSFTTMISNAGYSSCNIDRIDPAIVPSSLYAGTIIATGGSSPEKKRGSRSEARASASRPMTRSEMSESAR